MYNEEIQKLKAYLNEITNENEELKLARDHRDNEQVLEIMKDHDDGPPVVDNRVA
jgi:hypothetical protein